MVRKGGFEPPRLSAPPPQDGVSASSTTSARGNCHALNILATSSLAGKPDCTGFCTDLLHSTRVSDARAHPAPEQLLDRILAWMHVAHRRLNVIVSGDVLQCKRVRVLPGFGEKRVPERMQPGIGVS
jgi:hypothetical protein